MHEMLDPNNILVLLRALLCKKVVARQKCIVLRRGDMGGEPSLLKIGYSCR